MSFDVKRQGQYELFETTHHHRILVLDGRDYYALVQGDYGKIIVQSDSDHQKEKTLSEGDYVLFSARNEPNWKDKVDHLELRKGKDEYQTYILPNGFPTGRDQQKKLVESDERVPQSKVPGRQ